MCWLDAVSALDEALRGQFVLKDDVADALGRQGPRGQRRAEWVLAFADPLAESAGESWSRVQMHRMGAPAPRLQVRVLTRLGPRFPDFPWERPGMRPLGGEFDGAWKYGVIADANGEQPVDAVVREKQRDDALREHIDTLHWMWDDTLHPERLCRMLARAHVPVNTTLLPGWCTRRGARSPKRARCGCSRPVRSCQPRSRATAPLAQARARRGGSEDDEGRAAHEVLARPCRCGQRR